MLSHAAWLSVWHLSHCDVVSHVYLYHSVQQLSYCDGVSHAALLSVWYCDVVSHMYLYHSVQHLPYCDVVSHACMTQCLTSVSLWCGVPYVSISLSPHLSYCDVVSHAWTTQCLTTVSLWCCVPCVSLPLSPTTILPRIWIPCQSDSVSDFCLTVMLCPMCICTIQSNNYPSTMLHPIPIWLSVWLLSLFDVVSLINVPLVPSPALLWCCVPCLYHQCLTSLIMIPKCWLVSPRVQRMQRTQTLPWKHVVSCHIVSSF